MSKFCVLPKNYLCEPCKKEELKKACVIAHLYYEDELKDNIGYILEIPKELSVYIVTANDKLKTKVEDIIKNKKVKNINVILKPNRGRDFAALYVSSKDIIWKYKYVCFIHDKKSHKDDVKEFGKKWERCFFENAIGSTNYIKNIINEFSNDNKLGLLGVPLPPEPYLFSRRGGIYDANYNNVRKLLKRLKIDKTIDISRVPIGIGSCFWFRTKAMEKIKLLNIKYEDFPEEPMPNDGCFAHALERITESVVSSSGYKAKIAMNNQYAEYYLEMTEKLLDESAIALKENKVMRFKAGKVDLSKTNLIKIDNEFIEYCKSNRRIFLIIDENYELSNKCINDIKENKININKKYNIENINYDDIVVEPYFGTVVCTKKDSSKICAKLRKLNLSYYLYK